MKKSLLFYLASILLIAACGVSFFLGKKSAESERNSVIESLSLNGLGNTLLALRYLDENKPIEAQHFLQAQTNGQLSWLMELEKMNGESEFREQRCRVLNTLKQYREKHKLFKTENWNDLMNLPMAKEEEEKRIRYLDSMKCGNAVFFKVGGTP